MCELTKLLIPILSVIAAGAAAFAAFNANKIADALKRLQTNSILNQRELEFLNRVLELLKIYDVWCKEGGAGSNVNFHDSTESNYSSRDDAWSQIPRDIKFILIQLSSHSERLESLLSDWETGFISQINDDYVLDDKQVAEKIKSLRDIVSDSLLS